MERIASLIEQLQQALQRNADAAQMLVLSNMLQAELQKSAQQKNEHAGTARVAVVLPAAKFHVPETDQQEVPRVEITPDLHADVSEKILEVLQVNEEEVEAELEEIHQKAEFAKKLQAQQQQHKPVLLFDDEPEVPTLIHQPNYKETPKPVSSKELNEAVAAEGRSINEHLHEQKTEVGHKLTESSAIKDLKKAIGINDRFVFINELFRGDEVMYERSIKTINNFSIYPEAQYWMERELKIKLGWDNDRPATQEFYALVKRRFS
ncbi:MAG: hypothetical protein K2Q24_09115 [Chitinophagaceae bacterium]|nr:hypothetical protein [Chitinophagaceae bacterium]